MHVQSRTSIHNSSELSRSERTRSERDRRFSRREEKRGSNDAILNGTVYYIPNYLSHVGTRPTWSFTRGEPVKSCRDIFNKDNSLFQSQNRTDSRMAFGLVDSSTYVPFSLLHVSSRTFSEPVRRGHFRDTRKRFFTRPNAINDGYWYISPPIMHVKSFSLIFGECLRDLWLTIRFALLIFLSSRDPISLKHRLIRFPFASFYSAHP
jgi:hypothetical protein